MDAARAGWAEGDITPPLGLPMGGRGPRFAPGAAVLDPLLAQALVLEDARGNRTLWISVDQDGLTRDRVVKLRCELASLTGVPYEAVIINCSHTHSGPMGNYSMLATLLPPPEALGAYENERDRHILRLGWEAVEKLQPVKITWHLGQSHIGINRRKPNAAGETVMAPNPEGSYNPELWVLHLTTISGNDSCMLFSYGCHPVIVYKFCWDGLSADYPGVSRRRLKQNLGQRVHCQFIQGLAGDVRPRILADQDMVNFRRSTPADVAQVGAQLAEDVLNTLGVAGEILNLSLAAAAGWFHAKRDLQRIPPLSYWETLTQQEDELTRNFGQYWLKRLQAGLPLAQATPWEIGLIRLTPQHLIAWFAGEPLAEWLAHVRNWVDNAHLIAWGCCQDSSGYLPTDEQLPAGGYEVIESAQLFKTGPGPFAPGLNQAAKQSFQALVRTI
jgi:neutral ceramidase